MKDSEAPYIDVSVNLVFRISHIILWLSPAVGVLVTAILIESTIIKSTCQKFGVSASLSIIQAFNAIFITLAISIFWIAIRAQASQIQSRLMSIGGGIPLKDLTSWVSANSSLDLFRAYRSGSLSLWIVLVGLSATVINASSRLTYTVGNVSLGSRINTIHTIPEQSLQQWTVCGAGCRTVSPYIIGGHFDSLAASKTATIEGSYNASDGFTIYLPPPSFYGSGTTAIKRRGIIGGKVECWQQSEIPSEIYIDDMMQKDRIFHTMGSMVFIIATSMSANITSGVTWSAVLYLNKNKTTPKASKDGQYTVCNATAKIYDILAYASPSDEWEKSSMLKNLDPRLVFIGGDIESDGLHPWLDCEDCDYIGTENGNFTMALAFGSKVSALLSLPGNYANIGVDGKGYPIPSDVWLGYNYSRFFEDSDDFLRVTDNFRNRFMVALSEVNKVPDGMSVNLKVEETYVCVVNRWLVVYILLVLSGLIGFIGCYHILIMKSKLIDIGPKT